MNIVYKMPGIKKSTRHKSHLLSIEYNWIREKPQASIEQFE